MSSGSFGGVMVGVRGASLVVAGALAAAAASTARGTACRSSSREPSVDGVSRTTWAPTSLGHRAGNVWLRGSASGDGQYRRSCRACRELVHPMAPSLFYPASGSSG
jgi:hypothetical protein